MPQYKSYPKAKDTPSRRSRKGARNTAFQFNRKLAKKLRKEARVARNEAA